MTGQSWSGFAGRTNSFWALHIDPRRLWAPRTVRLAGELARDAWPPDLAPALLTTLARQSVDTVAMSILAIAMAAGGGVVLAFLAARTFTDSPNVLESAAPPWPVPWLRLATQWLARLGLLVCRAIPASVWALLALFVLFPGVLPGAVALGIYTLGVLGRLMAEVVEGLDPRPLRALGTLGATPAQAFGYGALPQSLPGFLSYSLYRWEVCSRETVIVGVVGAAGLGRVLTEQLSSFDHDGVMTTLLCFVALTWGVDVVGARARRVVRVR